MRILNGVRFGVALAVAALALAGCSAASNQQEQQSAASSADRVEVVVRADGPDGESERTVIECPADEACGRLGTADFAAPDEEQCAQVYGGPATATVKGRVASRAVNAEFTLKDSCAIDRWREFSWLLGPVPGQ